ncbi:MAG: helix-turn-helix domain-containing protein [Rivularia sp. (in: cyanobacteria)]
MYIGTAEAAPLLKITKARVRCLLAEGRIKGAYKVGRTWIIPLFKGKPIISRGSRGPKAKWCRRIPGKTTINVNRSLIKQNRNRQNPHPVISVKRHDSNTYAHSVKINGPCELVYRPEKPLKCGAVLWLETYSTVEIR